MGYLPLKSINSHIHLSVTPALSDARSKQSRAAAYRLIRHGLVNSESVKRLVEQPLDWYVVKYDTFFCSSRGSQRHSDH
jgi:hypothetical protein